LAHAADPEPHAAEAAADRAAQAAASNRPLENIQVLPRSWPRERVLTYMKNVVSAGLGVRCTFCHEGKDFAKDTEHKREARAMIRLTQEVNRKFFAGKARVSCMTCHQGHKEPQAGLWPGPGARRGGHCAKRQTGAGMLRHSLVGAPLVRAIR
jgi:hypothetical protein